MKSDHIGLETMRHSAAHVMAAAVRRLWPDALFDIGPDTADGFYYDFDLKHRLTVEDFSAIEAEMAKIIAENAPFVREEKTREEVLAMMTQRGQKYKMERLADIPAGRDDQPVPQRRFHRPVPRAARGEHRRDQGLQADCPSPARISAATRKIR
jgi:threonyl-tRNA synthetase